MEIGLSQGFYGFIYFDPTPEELIETAKSNFDTLRMGIHTEKGKDYLVYGNGYGTTHSTVSKAMGQLNPRCRPSRIDGCYYEGINGGTVILYIDRNRVLINASDWSMSEEAKPEDVARYMKQPAQHQFKELIRLIRENMEL